MPVVIAAGSIRANRTLSSCIMRQQGKATLPLPLPPLPLFTLPLRSYLKRLSFLQRSNNKSRRTCVQWLDSRDGMGDGSADYAGLVTSAATKWKPYLMNVDPTRARGKEPGWAGEWDQWAEFVSCFADCLQKLINVSALDWMLIDELMGNWERNVVLVRERERERENCEQNLLHVWERERKRTANWIFYMWEEDRELPTESSI